MRRAPLFALLWFALTGCPAVNSPPCDSDADCEGGRCRRGACGPFCLNDSECGSDQVCQSGKCVPKPECAADSDCADLFACRAGRCECTTDGACAANQACLQGRCEARPRCTSDADCAGTGRRCEVTQGLCVPPCRLPTDCAPGLDPRIAVALYTCFEGACLRRCAGDATCGQGLICENGVCNVAECKTLADCPAGKYCTDANFGRCVDYQVCSSTSECPKNFECRAFAPTACPPGFDCRQKICQELPVCLIDADCPAPAPNQPRQSYCQDGHCQPTIRCTAPTTCPSGQHCVAGLCVPGGCRGHSECGASRACVDGRCVDAPAPGDINALSLLPRFGLLAVGDTLQFTLVAYRLDGSSFPLSSGAFTVVDAQGNPTTAASIDSRGRLTAAGAGKVRVRATVTGANVSAQEAAVTIYPAVASGRRVIAIEAATGAPIPNARVVGCDDPPAAQSCPSPAEVTTDADGVALFPAFVGNTASFHVAPTDVRSDGLPRFDRMSVVATTASDILLPLAENPVHGAAGFNATISFADVRSTGSYWVGYAVLSAGDLSDLDFRTLLGEPFNVELPGTNQSIPVPGSVVLYTSPGLGIPQEVKARSLGLGHAGARAAVAFAGRNTLAGAAQLRSVELLGYTGAMDYAIQTNVSVPHLSRVPDTADVDGDGLRAQPSKCPQGSEDVPNYASFAPLSFRPRREQERRTEVVLPNVPARFDAVAVAAVEVGHTFGVLPLGFGSRAAGALGQDGTRPVPPIVLRSGAPYGGLEVGQPGIWAMAFSSAEASGALSGRESVTARLVKGPTLPTKVLVPPFLPIPSGGSYAAPTRTFAPGQPAWSSAYSGGADLAKVVLTGAQQRHVVWFRLQGSQTAVRVPEGPAGLGGDPGSEPSVSLEVVVLDFGASTAEELLTLSGPNLWNPALAVDGYSRSAP